MKTFKQIVLFTAVLAMTVSCTHYDDFFGHHKTKFVTVPFEAQFIGDYKYAGPDEEDATGLEPKCDNVRVIVDFEGSGTPIGNITGNFDFCVGPEGGYGQTEAYMVTEKGDSLFISISGKVIQGRLDDMPEYVTSYWQDPFEILGGTGRYQGATGSGMSNDYNSSQDINSHHNWSGTITMMK